MAEASSTIKMVDTMMGNGKRIRCMGGVSCIMKEVSLLIRATGLTINFMDMAKFIMIILLN